jgi:hypothetical protein
LALALHAGHSRLTVSEIAVTASHPVDNRQFPPSAAVNNEQALKNLFSSACL